MARKILFAVLLFLLVVGASGWLALHSETFWRWAGYRLLAAANDQLQGELRVQSIQGTPFSGYAWQGLSLTTPAGEVFRAKGFLLRLSLWSLLRLEPVVDKVALYEPVVNLVQDEDGGWNLDRLWQPRGGPPARVAMPIAAVNVLRAVLDRGTILIQRPDQGYRLENLDVSLQVRLDQLGSSRWRLEVVDLQAAAATPWGPYALSARFNFSVGALDLAALRLTTANQPLLTASGRLCLDGPGDSTLAGAIGPLPVGFISRFFGAWPPAWKVEGSFHVRGAPHDFQFNLSGAIHQATVDLQGRFRLTDERQQYDGRLHLANLTPEMLAALQVPGSDVYGQATPLSASLHLQGTGLSWPPPAFSWRLETEAVSWQAARVEKVALQATGTGAAQELAGEVQGNFGSLRLTGKGSFFTDPCGHITLQVVDFRPGLVGLPAAGDTVLTAGFDGDFRLADLHRWESLTLLGAVQASGRLHGQPLHNVQGRFAWEPPRLSIPGLKAQLGNVAAELSGVLEGDRLHFRHQGATRPGGNWPVPRTVTGALSWTGTIRGTLAAPDYVLEARGQGLSVAGVGLQAFSLQAQGLGLPPRSGILEFTAGKVKTQVGTWEQVRLRANGWDNCWCYRFRAASPAPGPRAELYGRINLGSRPLAVAISHLSLEGWGVRIKNLKLLEARLLPGLELPGAVVDVNGGTVQLAAHLRGAALAARLEVRHLPLALARIQGLHGRLQSVVTLSGSLQKPDMAGSISLTDLTYNTYAIHALQTALSYREGLWRLTGHAEEKPGGVRLNWEGKLPQEVSLAPFRLSPPGAGLDFSLGSRGGNLRLLEGLVPAIARADVPVELALQARGDWRRPDVVAAVRWQEGFLSLHQAGTRYLVSPGVLHWQADRLALPQLTLTSVGLLKLSGDVAFQGFFPHQVHARVDLENFKVLDRLASEAFLDGQLTLTGPPSALVLRGQLSLPRAILNPALIRPTTRTHPDIVRVHEKQRLVDPEPAPTTGFDFYRRMKIDLALTAPGSVWIKQKTPQMGAAVELSLDIQARKNPGQDVALGGLVRSREGNVRIFSKEFSVDQARLTLPGVPQQQPFLEARLSHAMADATLLVDVFGPLDRPQIQLSSSPPMPPNDLMSYLLFNRPAGALSQSEFNAGQEAVGVLGGMTARKIQEILGDDFPILGDISVKGSAAGIGLSRTLIKGVTLSVERRTSPTAREDPTTVRLEYRINRRLRLQAEHGQRNTGGDVLFKYDF